MAVLLGLLVAATYGSADFLGGYASKSSPAAVTVAASQSVSLVVAALLALVVGGVIHAADLGYGALGGCCGLVGVLCLYRGLAVGRMSVVAPLSAVGSALMQVVWGLLQGETPGTIALVGVAVALVAVGIVAGTAGEDATREGRASLEIALGLGAAVGFGGNLIFLDNTSHGSGLWPIVAARVAAVAVIGVALLVRGGARVPRRQDLRVIAGAGVLDAVANSLLIAAIRQDLISLVAPVAALYPAATVLLARLVVDERIGRARIAGLLLALAGLVLIGVR